MKHLKPLFLLPLVVLIFIGCKKEESIVRNAILVYPNPATDNVNIEVLFPKPGTVTLELIGNSNKPLFSTQTSQNANLTLDLTSYPNGVYKFVGTHDNGTKTITSFYIQRD